MSTDVHTLSGAYALDALSPEEAAEFRLHLAECEACRVEVLEFRQAAARMGAAESVDPPAELRGRILALADRTPQVPPRSVQAGTAPASRGRWTSWLAAAAAAVVIVGGGAVGLSQVLDQPDPRLAAGPVQVFEARDAKTATVETRNGGKLTVAVSPSRNEMAVDTRKLPRLDDEHVYTIWSVQGEQMVKVASLSDPTQGASMGMPAKGTQVAVTIEPKGNVTQPTTEPIVQVDPASV